MTINCRKCGAIFADLSDFGSFHRCIAPKSMACPTERVSNKLTAEQQIRIAALNAAIKVRTDLPYRMGLVYETAQEYEKYIKTGEII